jgi:hypothetical protein
MFVRPPLRTGFAAALLFSAPTLWAQPAPAPTPRAGAAPTARPTPETPAPPSDRTYTFQLVLLAAETVGGGATTFENVPANAQKALADVKEFLPYKSYKLLDLAWLRSSRMAEAQLSGPGGRTLSASIRFFSPGDEPERLEIQRLVVVESPEVQTMLLEAPRQDGAPTAVAPRAIRPLLETSFGMRAGETVVVGTAKLDGPSKALVVILSALP